MSDQRDFRTSPAKSSRFVRRPGEIWYVLHAAAAAG